jgi:uncharacterized protein
MRLRIHQVSLKLDYEPPDVLDAVVRLLGCRNDDLANLQILRRSIDARRKDAPPRFVLSVEVDFEGIAKPALTPGRVELAESPKPAVTVLPMAPRKKQPIVVGTGPAGLLAALTLAEAGAKPLLIERGSEVQVRSHQVQTFWNEGTLDPESNVLYGEGGAGLFSDGKLTSRSKDRGAVQRLFQLLVECGAPSDILIDAEPHLGSDVLACLIPALRARIREHGGEVLFNTRLEDIHVEDGCLRGVTISGSEVDTDTCFLATGHSARDVYRMLAESDVPMAAKPFAVGLRLEMPQSRIDVAQYGRWSSHPQLQSASFRITRKPSKEARACYTFCPCPGGLVMACASSPGMITTNGMSYSSRAKPFGNAAFLVPVGPDEYEGDAPADALTGIAFQEAMEQAAFTAGGGDYGLPAQPLVDFLEARASTDIPDKRSCTRAVPSDLAALLPDDVAATLRAALPKMLRELNGIRHEDVLLYGVETRSSSSVRILRNPQTRESLGVRGLFPLGEGSGYTGGIVSSALDGMFAPLRDSPSLLEC